MHTGCTVQRCFGEHFEARRRAAWCFRCVSMYPVKPLPPPRDLRLSSEALAAFEAGLPVEMRELL